MTNEELQDLKQFIQATVSQATAELATKEDVRLVDEKLDRVQDAIADTLVQATEPISEAVEDHEKRLRKLEKRLA